MFLNLNLFNLDVLQEVAMVVAVGKVRFFSKSKVRNNLVNRKARFDQNISKYFLTQMSFKLLTKF
jgi:hypothetical protein